MVTDLPLLILQKHWEKFHCYFIWEIDTYSPDCKHIRCVLKWKHSITSRSVWFWNPSRKTITYSSYHKSVMLHVHFMRTSSWEWNCKKTSQSYWLYQDIVHAECQGYKLTYSYYYFQKKWCLIKYNHIIYHEDYNFFHFSAIVFAFMKGTR